MLISAQQLLQSEESSLAPYALRSSQSKGRKYAEIADPYRCSFQRDRDRIVHSKAFRRLSGKTQVFVATHGDHFRSRLTHSLEVSQVSRDVARTLGLNEDLCEVIALAHDLGHTPFGHAGEEAMHDMMTRCDSQFEHNDQSKRIVETLERKSPDYPGLNLSFETLEGMMKHRKMHDDGKTLVIHSLESQLVDTADAIAYHHHDLDDGLRSGILSSDHISAHVDIWKQAIEDLDSACLGEDLFRHLAINNVIGLMIHDLAESAHKNIEEAGIGEPITSPEYHSVIRFGHTMQKKVDQLAEYLGQTFYLHETVTRYSAQGQSVIKGLFRLFTKKFELLPKSIRDLYKHEHQHIVIKDYIAGMTDHYASTFFAEHKNIL
ncbi:MAG: dNTP triphosphohydrolase [Candidatus Gracilibacteria bacterium]|nr:dNTP triphosphohydrolase [Candidatus Gracilibacteria bacterium]